MLFQAAGLALLSALSPTALLVAAVYLGSARPTLTSLFYLAGATVMMLSSSADYADQVRCAEMGIAAYLTKPVYAADLLAAIERAIGSKPSSSAPAKLPANRSPCCWPSRWQP